MTECRICNNSIANKSHIACEMYFGYRDEFEYFECSNCGCLQIRDILDNLSKYYPENYYSHTQLRRSKQSLPLTFLKRQRLKYYLGEKNLTGMLFTKIFGAPHFRPWVKKAELMSGYHILDVGSGIGSRLLYLEKKGFSKLTGVDPFIKNDVIYENGVQVLKKRVEDVEGQFDFIMLHHSFEHMADPLTTLKHLYHILKPNRFALIRIPVTSSLAWEKYKTNWVQLDAPRHLFLHSIKSMEILAEHAGFSIGDIIFDSTLFQFWGSEQYRSDIPLTDARSYSNSPAGSIFSEKDIREFEHKTNVLNKSKKGDQACFYLYKT